MFSTLTPLVIKGSRGGVHTEIVILAFFFLMASGTCKKKSEQYLIVIDSAAEILQMNKKS